LSEDELANKCIEMTDALLKNPGYLSDIWCSFN
jgi:hypothetical protein